MHSKGRTGTGWLIIAGLLGAVLLLSPHAPLAAQNGVERPLLIDSGLAETDEETAELPETTADRGTEVVPEPDTSSNEKERRRLNVSLGWIMLAGVISLGLLLLLMVLLLGGIVKRRTRQPLPAAPLRRPFWYLETGPEQIEDSPRKPEES